MKTDDYLFSTFSKLSDGKDNYLIQGDVIGKKLVTDMNGAAKRDYCKHSQTLFTAWSIMNMRKGSTRAMRGSI